LISTKIAISSLGFVLALGAAGRVWAAECPIVQPIAGAFRAVRVAPGTIVSFPPQAGTTAATQAELHRGMTLSGAITGFNASAADAEMSLTLTLDLVRYLTTGQGYGSGEVTISTRPATPFLSASPVFQGRLDAVVTAGNQLTGTFCAAGSGAYTGTSVRGRFTARLTTAAPSPGPAPGPGANPGPLPGPFGTGPTNPLVPGPGSANPFATPSGPPTNPLTTPPGNPPSTASLVTLEINGAFGAGGSPTIVVEHDPLGMMGMSGGPDLGQAASGLMPLIQPSSAKLSINCTGGVVKFCPSGGIPTAKEGVESRTGMIGKGTTTVRAGRASARYRVEVTLDAIRTTGGDPGDNDFGYAQGRVRFFTKEPTPVYEGTLDGAVTPQFVRGRPVKNRFVWSGFAALNGRPTPDGRIVDSLRSAFTAIGTYSKSRTAPVRLVIVFGDKDDPFVRVMSGLPNR
jgi:hypothetical protein